MVTPQRYRSVPNESKMLAEQGPLQPQIILEKLGQSLFSINPVFRRTLESTNTLAKELGSTGSPEGTIVVTEEQTAGRGRRGRSWISPPSVNILLSILLRPDLDPDNVFVLTMILGLAVIEAVKGATHLEPRIKWPNDLYVKRRKLAGILTEFSLKEREIEYVIMGLGLNVNWSPGDRGLQGEFATPPTSILEETGIEISRNDLLVAILKIFEGYYLRVVSGEIESFYETWNKLSLIIGRNIEIESGDDVIRGKALRIDRSGALIIEDNEGQEQKILCGDVSLTF